MCFTSNISFMERTTADVNSMALSERKTVGNIAKPSITFLSSVSAIVCASRVSIGHNQHQRQKQQITVSTYFAPRSATSRHEIVSYCSTRKMGD